MRGSRSNAALLRSGPPAPGPVHQTGGDASSYFSGDTDWDVSSDRALYLLPFGFIPVDPTASFVAGTVFSNAAAILPPTPHPAPRHSVSVILAQQIPPGDYAARWRAIRLLLILSAVSEQ